MKTWLEENIAFADKDVMGGPDPEAPEVIKTDKVLVADARAVLAAKETALPGIYVEDARMEGEAAYAMVRWCYSVARFCELAAERRARRIERRTERLRRKPRRRRRRRDGWRRRRRRPRRRRGRRIPTRYALLIHRRFYEVSTAGG